MTIPAKPPAPLLPEHSGYWAEDNENRQGRNQGLVLSVEGNFCYWYGFWPDGRQFHVHWTLSDQRAWATRMDGNRIVVYQIGEAYVFPTDKGLTLVYDIDGLGRDGIDFVQILAAKVEAYATLPGEGVTLSDCPFGHWYGTSESGQEWLELYLFEHEGWDEPAFGRATGKFRGNEGSIKTVGHYDCPSETRITGDIDGQPIDWPLEKIA